jgi:hypothetical protein
MYQVCSNAIAYILQHLGYIHTMGFVFNSLLTSGISSLRSLLGHSGTTAVAECTIVVAANIKDIKQSFMR